MECRTVAAQAQERSAPSEIRIGSARLSTRLASHQERVSTVERGTQEEAVWNKCDASKIGNVLLETLAPS